MPKSEYPFELGGDVGVSVSWTRKGPVRVDYDGASVGTAADFGSLKTIHRFNTPDGRRLSVEKRKPRFLHPAGLFVELDGEAMPGSAGHPIARVHRASEIILFLGGVNILLCPLLALGILFETSMVHAGVSAIAGLVLLGLGALIHRQHLMWALGLAFGLLLASLLADVAFLVASGGMGPGALAVKIILLMMVFPGFGGIRELRAMQDAG